VLPSQQGGGAVRRAIVYGASLGSKEVVEDGSAVEVVMHLRAPRRTMRTWLRAQYMVTPRDIDGWNDLTDRMQPPTEPLYAFLRLHTEVRSESLTWLWEAFLQWVRVHGRFGETWNWPPLCQPSLAVDDLWQLLARDPIRWGELPEHVQRMERVAVREPQSRANLYETYAKAYYDEYGPPLPVLFRVDELLGVSEGRLYRAECMVNAWGVPLRDCPAESDAGRDPEPGRTCLHKIPWVAIQGDIGGF
jgi:hypothetical protein